MSSPSSREERLFGQVLIELKLATSRQLQAALQVQAELAVSGTRKPLGQLLVEQNVLRLEDVHRTLQASGTPFGRYRLLEKLGEGGMGVVHRAWDTQLKRVVALKRIRLKQEGQSQLVERFLREARVAAGLRHPHLVAVYDVGRIEDQYYLTMDYIQGKTYDAHLQGTRELRGKGRKEGYAGLRVEIEWLIQIARAVDCAHQNGLIHRDLKPGNILLDSSGRAYVTDFGLAKQLQDVGEPVGFAQGSERAGQIEGPGRAVSSFEASAGPEGLKQQPLTVSGQLLGTPAYMSPEQAEGKTSGAGSAMDIYALGAILYETLTGKPPFESESVARTLASILREEPVPPSRVNRLCPKDLETSCLKCLQKDSLRRYGSAEGLAADLERWLAGEPILARRSEWTYRIGKRIRRNPWAWGLGAAALLVAILASVIVGVSAWRLSAERAQVLREMRSVTDLYLELALEKRRAGKLQEMKAQLEGVQGACERAKERAPWMAEPHYQLGRMYRALMMWEKAYLEQEAALEKEPDYAPARYERGLLRIRRYQEELESARSRWMSREGERLWKVGGGEVDSGMEMQLPGPDILGREEPQLLRWEQGAKEDLERAGDRGAARALLAVLRGDEVEAKRLFAAAHQKDAYLEEPYEWLGELAGKLEEAQEWFAAGIEKDRGYLPFWWGRALARRAEASRSHRGKGPAAPGPLYRAAIEDCTEAIRLDPERYEAWMHRAEVRTDWGTCNANQGKDPSALYEAAIADHDQALARDPDRDELWRGRGDACLSWGVCKGNRGEDPTELFNAAIEDFEEALRLNSKQDETWRSLALVRVNLGFTLEGRGEDPSELYERAIGDYGEALRRNPERDETWRGRGNARVNLGLYKESLGEKPGTLYEAAIKDYGEALKRDPNDDETWRSRAQARGNWGVFVASQGGDPRALYEAAIQDCGAALERWEGRDETWRTRGDLRGNQGLYEESCGGDPTDLYQAAIEDYGKALTRNAARAETWQALGGAHFNLGLYRESAGEDPAPSYAKAIEEYGEALKLNPGWSETWMSLGRAQASWGTFVMNQGEDPGLFYGAAVEDFGQSLKLNPESQETWGSRGLARLNWGIFTLQCGEDPMDLFRAAIIDLGEALARNPAPAELWMRRGLAHAASAFWQHSHGQEVRSHCEAAVEDFSRSLERDPSNAELWFRRGDSRAMLGDWSGALADFQEAIRKDPGLEEPLRQPMAECRQELEEQE